MATILIIGLICASNVYAEEQTAAQTIKKIVIIGNEKTKEAVIMRIIKIKQGDTYEDGLEKTIEQRLNNTRRFYDVKVFAFKETDGVTIDVRVNDKWSLIPFPFATFRDGEAKYGFTVFDINFLGYQKTVFTAIVIDNGKLNEALGYSDRFVFGSDFRFSFAFRNMNTRHFDWNETAKVGGYTQMDTGFNVSTGYAFTENISAGLSYRYFDTRFADTKDTVTRPDNAIEGVAGISLEFEKSDHMEDFTKGVQARLNYERDFKALGSELDRRIYGWRMSFFINPVSHHNLVISSSGGYGVNLPYGRLFRINELRGYDRDRFDAVRYAATTVEYRVPFYSLKDANLSFVPFADNAMFNNRYQAFTLKESRNDVGASFRVYLRRIVLPAFQIYGAYGFESKEFKAGLAIGAMM